MKKILFLLLATLFAIQGWSQETITIGNGTTGVFDRPINTYYNYSVTQQIYTASDIITANGGTQPTGMAITQIGFPYFYATSSAYNNIDIYLCNTTKTEFTGTAASNWEPYANLAQVYSGSITFNNATGWTMVTLQTPFIWDGVSNIILCINDRKGTYLTSSNNTFYTHSTTNYTSMHQRRDGSIAYDITSTFPAAYARLQSRNNIRFVFEATPTCIFPTTPLSSDILPFTATVSWAHHPLSTATAWEVQYKPASESDWANATVIPVTDTFANLSNLTSATTYNWRVKEVCGAGSDEGIDFSSWANGNFTTVISCPAPTGVNAPLATITTEEAVVVWNSLPLALEYEIQYKENSVSNWTDPSVVSETVYDTAYLMSGLSANTIYNFRVRATCDIGNDYSTYSTCNVRTACGNITALPWSDSFDTYGTGTTIFPTCWTKNTTYTDRPYVNATNHSAPASLYFYANTTGNYNIAATPQFDESIAINSLRVKGWHYYSSLVAAIEVGVMTDPTDASTFVSIATVQSVGSWAPFEVPLSSYQGEGHYIAFKTDGAVASGYGYLDDIVIEPIPECPDIYDFSVVQGSNYSAKVAWDNGVTDAAQSGWILAWDELPAASFDPETATNTVPLTATDMPHFVQSLTSGSTYSFAMRSACTDGVWSATNTITILDASEIVSVPYYEDFEITDTLSFYSSSTVNKWAIGSATGNPGNSMYISDNNGAANAYTITNTTYASASIPVEFGNYEEYALQFDWKARGESASYDYMRVYLVPLAYTPSGAWPSGAGVQQLGGNLNLQSSWQHANILINGSNSGTIQKLLFVWWNDGSGGTQPPAAVDNIDIQGFMCASPSNIQASAITQTSANLTWTSPTSAATDWILYYRPTGTTTVDSVLVSGTAEHTLTNLSPSINYQVWIKADCGTDGLSANSPVYTFMTLCEEIASVPWTENFDTYGTGSYAYFPPCFSRQNTYSSTGYPYISSTYTHSSPGALYNYAPTAGTYSLSVTPKFDESLPLNILRLKFWHYAPYTTAPLKVGVMSNPADVNTFVELQTYTVSVANTWEERELLLNNAPDTCHYIAFMTVNVSTGYGYGYIDDIAVDSIPPCPDVYDFSVVMGTNNTAIVSWDNTVVDELASGWTIVYDEVAAADFDPTTATNNFLATANEMPYTISGLTVGSTYTFAMRGACDGSWTTPISITVPAVNTLPYSQDFEDLTDVDEFNFVTGGSNEWYTGNLTGNPGNSMYISSTGGTSLDYAANAFQLSTASVVIDFGEYAEYNVSFDWKGNGETSYDYMLAYLVPVGVALPTVGAISWAGPSDGLQITAPGNSSSYPSGRFNNATYSGASTSWKHVSFTVPGSLSGTVQQLVFFFQCDNLYEYSPGVCVDNIVITGTMCGSPYNVTSNAVTQTTADITWEQVGSSTDWWLYWSAAGSNVVDSIDVSGTPAYTLTDLAAGTPYNVWLKNDCGSDGISGNSAIHSFNTVCATISTFPYIQNFDDCPSGANLAAFPNCWTRLNNYSTAYYPYVSTTMAFSGAQSLYWYQPTTTNIHMAAIPPMIDPAIDVSTIRVKFKMRYTATNAVGFQVGMLTNPTNYSTFVPVGAPQYITTPNVWEDKEIHLSSYVPTDPLNPARYIALTTFSNGSQSSYFYIDDFVIDTIPSCADVYNFALDDVSSTSVSLSWLTTGYGDNGGAGWTIVYAPTPSALFDPTTAPNSEQVTATGMPYTISGLLPGQIYTFAMQSSCGGAWSSYIQIVTPQALPYSIDFSDATENQNWIVLSNNNYLWSAGIEVGNPDESVYISNDNGATHAVGSYPTYSYFYKDFDFGSTPGSFNLNFDWLCQGYISGSSWYSGIMMHIRDIEDAQLPADLNSLPTWINDNSQFRLSLYGSDNTWQNVSRQLQNMSGIKRVVFVYFRTTTSSVPPPGAAIDNISITPTTCVVPTQASITDLTSQSVNVHWNNTGADSYSLTWQENTTGAIPNMVILNDTVYSLTGLTSATSYLFNVRAICGNDTTPYSTTWIITTLCETTGLPYTQNFDSYTGTTFNTAGIVPTCWTSSTTNTAYPAPHITGSGSYHYPHSAPNALTFTTGSAGNDAYAVLPLFDQPIANLSISFWYRYEVAIYGTLSVGFITGIQSDMSSFTSVASAPATVDLSQFTYDFSTSSVDLSNATYIVLHWYHNNSYYSCGVDDIEVTSGAATCITPVNVATENITSTAANVIWAAGDAETEWQITWKEATASDWNNPVGVAATTYNLSGLIAATNYNVRVRAICGEADTSTWTAIHNFTTLNLPPCAAPTEVAATAIFDAATITWTPGDTETEWQVTWKEVAASDWNNIAGASAIPYGISGLAASTDYEVKVRAVCGASDTSVWSDVATFTTLTCENPTNINPIAIDAHSITVAWQPMNGEDEWMVSWTNTSTGQRGSGDAHDEQYNGYAITDLIAGTEYKICIVAVCAPGAESDSINCINVTTAGIHDVTLANSLQLYPNPTTGELKIKNYELREGDKIEIYNVLGQKQQLTTNHYPLTTINVSHLSAGIYTVKIGGYVGKFVKK